MTGQLDMFGNIANGNEDYEAFEDKFKLKKTTDDCYTPANVYEAVAGWVASEYGVNRADMVRPFWPGGDFERFDYPTGCCVVDNPPFSIITRIQRVYLSRGIRFFLFAPTLTLFSGRGLDVTYIPCGVQITYANKAKVNTSFVTNLDTCRVRSAPTLYQVIRTQNDINEKAATVQLPKYEYPDHVLTAAVAYQYSRLGVEYRLEKADSTFISAMDAQRNVGKHIFGCGFLLSDRAAAERAAAERAAAERAAAKRAAAAKKNDVVVWELSDREYQIIAHMNEHGRES